MGTQQSGILKLKIADLVKDQELLKVARDEAKSLLINDPELNNNEHQVFIPYKYKKLLMWKPSFHI